MSTIELEPKDFLENTVLVNLTDNYDQGDDDFERYEAARGCWKISKDNAAQCKFVMAVHDGKIIEIYRPAVWFDAGTTMRLPKKVKPLSIEELKKRREFVGQIVKASDIRSRYIGQSVASMYAPPKQNSVRCIIDGKLVSEQGEYTNVTVLRFAEYVAYHAPFNILPNGMMLMVRHEQPILAYFMAHGRFR